jgi:4,5-dihydroxyphthalate decarboxylase
VAQRSLTYACEDYDLQQGIVDGSVRPAGVTIQAAIVESNERHDRMAREGAFDLAEFSMSAYLVARAKGLPLVGLPVFPRRMFVHRFMFVNAASGITEPAQLAGRRVGIGRHHNTLALVARGTLHDEHGLDLQSVQWVTERPETIGGDASSPYHFEAAPDGRSLEDLLLAGTIDAMMIPHMIDAWDRGDPRVRRLFPDFKAAERASYQRTGIFPIMHLVVARADVLRDEPGLGAALLAAFREAQERAFGRLGEPAMISLAWARALLEEERAFFGGAPWPIGVRENARTLEAMARWSHLLGLTPRQLTLEELFPGFV